MKKWIVFFAIGVLFLTGCGYKETGEYQSEPGYKEITLFCDVEFWDAPAWDISENSITGKISKETGAVVEVVDAMEDADRQLSMLLANDQLPDIVSVTDETVISQLITSGKVWKMEEFLKKYKPDSHLLKDFPEDIKYELIKRDGDWYSYPSHMSSPDNREKWKPSKFYQQEVESSWSLVIMWNKALLQELGLNIQELKSEEQVLKAFEKAKYAKTTDGESMIPLLVDGEFCREYTLQFLASSFGAEYIDQDGNYMDYYRQPEMKDALSFLNKAVREGYAMPEQLVYENNRVKKCLKEENVLCFIGNVANSGIDGEMWESSGAILSDTGEAPVYMQNLRRTTGWLNTFISKDCESPKEAAKLLDYMTSDAGQMIWVYGTEGVHYTLNDNGKVVLTKAGVEAQGNYVQSGVNVWWMFFNLDWSRSKIEASEDVLDNHIACAYVLDERTCSYDGTALQYLDEGYDRDPVYKQIEAEIEKWKQEQVKLVILARTESEFETEYENLMQGLEERQIEKLDQKKNEQYQKNCKEYDVYIKKVNEHEKSPVDDIEKTSE